MTKSSMSMAGAAVLQFASKYASIAVQLLVTAVLARLVSPDDFGLISIVTVFSAFFQLFSDMGVGVSVVQFRDLDEGVDIMQKMLEEAGVKLTDTDRKSDRK